MEIIYWSVFENNQWPLHVAASSKGLCFVGTPGQGLVELEAWVKKHRPTSQLMKDNRILDPYISELREYLEGTRTSFAMPVDTKGTPFQQTIWDALKEIPYGRTVTYSDIADRIGKPSAVRAVGSAIGANPVMITIPCHRVIGKNGTLTGFRGGIEMKKFLLEHEHTFSAVHQ
ncbi:methylated-DNA--[protein]-cysteine S-methyltransferase [Bacillus sp. FJAT-27225]|uniref:methylated-DNA--[protein]-cysteine S-methyltransferase n=1 Tax=Bacillus sp. FJAT-27225 TaxID=1743144 RepID=UPI000AC37572|nr:methylated-DNA--[protein]-cysteine S-methyltransferase [Bacillus sp. FJAT-27225]